MRRLALLALALVTIFALLMGGALVIGRAQPPSERIERLHLTDCDPPCWNGITPRVSSRGELEQRIALTFPDFQAMGMSSSLPFLTWRKNGVSIDVAIDDGIVHSLGMGTELTRWYMPRLGDMLVMFGAPSCITIDEKASFSALYYENTAHEMIIQVTTTSTSVFKPIVSIDFGVYKLFSCPKDSVSWQDFRRSQATFFSAS